MKRDSLFGEPVVWSGSPKEVSTPPLYRISAMVCGVVAGITTASALVVGTALGTRPTALVLSGAWMAILGVALFYGPRWWRSGLEFVLTERHIIIRRGRMRRTIDRREISFARIHWHPSHPGIGDLELVRAVPTGALRRRLSIMLSGLAAPDRVWAIVRGVTPAAAVGDGQRLLAQRLDEGESVLWSAHPSGGWKSWLPTGGRAFGSLAISLALGGSATVVGMRSVDILRGLARVGLDPHSGTFVGLVATLSMTMVLLAVASLGVAYNVLVRPARLAARTRYWVTNRRVLIQRGDEELHLERSRIVDVIDAPHGAGLKDLFLVLDGPKARALAASGAFGEAEAQGLLPVLHRVADAEVVQRILQAPSDRSLPEAA